MKNIVPTRIPVIIIALIFGYFGVNHLLHADMMSGMVPSMFPAHKFFVYLTGICFLLAAIAFIVNRYAKVAGYLLALLLLIIICTIHLPGMMNAADDGSKMMFTTMAVKDLGLAMGAIIIANISRQ
jgi:putative oxidoreductase